MIDGEKLSQTVRILCCEHQGKELTSYVLPFYLDFPYPKSLPGRTPASNVVILTNFCVCSKLILKTSLLISTLTTFPPPFFAPSLCTYTFEGYLSKIIFILVFWLGFGDLFVCKIQ